MVVVDAAGPNALTIDLSRLGGPELENPDMPRRLLP
jgi:hypothetical protein